jgi:hypothetical protein
MESFMEVGQGPNWVCNAKEKKKIKQGFFSLPYVKDDVSQREYVTRK